MQAVLDRAIARGEIDPDRLSPRIASLPFDLVCHDLIMNRSPVPDPALIEIVDRIFLPLLRRESPDATPADTLWPPGTAGSQPYPT